MVAVGQGPFNSVRRIDALMVGGTVYSIDQVIVWIEVDGHTFWVKVAGREVQEIGRAHV